MNLYRLTKPLYAEDKSGTGAYLYGGRWNRQGTHLLYTASNPALAVAEAWVHVSIAAWLDVFSMVHFQLPDDCLILDLNQAQLDKDWRTNEELTQEAGQDWIYARKSIGLRVPSAVVPDDYNILINPLHPDISLLVIQKVVPFRFDRRMWKKETR